MSALRRLLWLVLAVVGVAALSVAALDAPAETSGERIQRLSDSYACPTCMGQTVAESNASSATTIRDFIRTRVDEGASDAAIRDELVQAYGGEVLLTPRSDGVSALIWILPTMVAVGGGAVVVASLRRSPPAHRIASDEDRALVAAAIRHNEPASGSPPGTTASDAVDRHGEGDGR